MQRVNAINIARDAGREQVSYNSSIGPSKKIKRSLRIEPAQQRHWFGLLECRSTLTSKDHVCENQRSKAACAPFVVRSRRVGCTWQQLQLLLLYYYCIIHVPRLEHMHGCFRWERPKNAQVIPTNGTAKLLPVCPCRMFGAILRRERRSLADNKIKTCVEQHSDEGSMAFTYDTRYTIVYDHRLGVRRYHSRQVCSYNIASCMH